MSRKLYYAIDYRRMHTGVHGLILYEDKVTAEKAMTMIRRLLQKADRFDRSDATETERYNLEVEYELTIQQVFDMAVEVLEEINYKNIICVVKYNKNLKEYKYKVNNRTVRVINTSVDLYI